MDSSGFVKGCCPFFSIEAFYEFIFWGVGFLEYCFGFGVADRDHPVGVFYSTIRMVSDGGGCLVGNAYHSLALPVLHLATFGGA